MPKIAIGDRFGRLVLIGGPTVEFMGKSKTPEACALCRCDCGTEKLIRLRSMTNGITKSCGCLRRERHLQSITKHGGHRTRLYRIYWNIKERCLNPKNPDFVRYGGAGIGLCQAWSDSFVAFRDWSLANGYADDLTIDRIDNYLGYAPENCRWISEAEQHNNRRANYQITAFNVTLNPAQWAKQPICSVSRSTIRQRIRLGWTPERAITEPLADKFQNLHG